MPSASTGPPRQARAIVHSLDWSALQFMSCPPYFYTLCIKKKTNASEYSNTQTYQLHILYPTKIVKYR